MSKNKGEVKRFLDFYFDEDTQTDDDVMEWIYVYNNTVDAVNIIECFIDNDEKFDVSLWVKIDGEELVRVKKCNIKSIIEKIHKYFNMK